MATGLVNPYAVAGENTRYRDAVLADNPMSLWMLDEPYGDNVAVDQGNSPSDGTYTGALATSSTQRGSRTIFGLDAIGNATTGVVGGYVWCPINASNQASLNQSYNGLRSTFEFLLHLDAGATTQANYLMYAWTPWYIQFYNNRLESKWSGGTGSLPYNSAVGALSTGTDYHVALMAIGYSAQTQWQFYVNGVALPRVLYSAGWQGMSVQNKVLIGGSAYAGTGLAGAIAGVALYDHLLGASVIAAHYNALL